MRVPPSTLRRRMYVTGAFNIPFARDAFTRVLLRGGGGKAGNQGSRVLERSLLPFLLIFSCAFLDLALSLSLVSLCLFLALPPSHHFQKHIYHRTHCAHRIHRTHILNKLSHNKLCDITCVSSNVLYTFSLTVCMCRTAICIISCNAIQNIQV